jgi:hypothetical protein
MDNFPYGRPIRTLDAIPDEELDRLRGWGFTGLWLIGLWERSRASQRINRHNPLRRRRRLNLGSASRYHRPFGRG